MSANEKGLTRCRVCGCTELHACEMGCSWVFDDLCSICAEAVDAVTAWVREARRANKAALWREVEATLKEGRAA